MRILQTPATLGNTLIITRSEQVSGSSPLVGSLFCVGLQEKLGNKDKGQDLSWPNLPHNLLPAAAALSEICDSLCSLFLPGGSPKGFYILYVDAPFLKLHSPSLFEFPEGPRHRYPVRPDHRAQPLVGVVRWYLVALPRPDTLALDEQQDKAR